MNIMFIIHESRLLDEYYLPANKEGMESHWISKDTERLTSLLTTTRRRLGTPARLNPCTWLLRTGLTDGEVLDHIRAAWNGGDDISKAGDIFVIHAQQFAAQSDQDTINTLNEIISAEMAPVRGLQNTDAPDSERPATPMDAKAVKQTVSSLERFSELYEIKETDAMRYRLPGSFGSGKRR